MHWNNLSNIQRSIWVYRVAVQCCLEMVAYDYEILEFYVCRSSRSVYIFLYSPDGAQFGVRVSDHKTSAKANRWYVKVNAKVGEDAVRRFAAKLCEHDPRKPCPYEHDHLD